MLGRLSSINPGRALINVIIMCFRKCALSLYYYFYLGGSLIALFIGSFFIEYGWKVFFVWLLFHYFMVSALSFSYHRFFAHKTFHANRVIQFIIALYGIFCLQRGPLWWSSIHRMHHRYCGMPQDPHTMDKGLYYCHVGWTRDPKYQKIQWKYIPDLAQFPELRLLENLYYYLIPVVSILLYQRGGWGYVIAYHVAITTSVNSIACLNSMCHKKNQGKCYSLNLKWLAWFTLGEGLHDSHHQYPGSAKILANPIDFTYWFIRVLRALKLVKDVR